MALQVSSSSLSFHDRNVSYKGMLGAIHNEWNENTRMKIVPHSHDKIDRLSLWCSRHLENDTHAPRAPDHAVCGFHLGTMFIFSLHDTGMKCHTRTRISLALKTGMNSIRNDLYKN